MQIFYTDFWLKLALRSNFVFSAFALLTPKTHVFDYKFLCIHLTVFLAFLCGKSALLAIKNIAHLFLRCIFLFSIVFCRLPKRKND